MSRLRVSSPPKGAGGVASSADLTTEAAARAAADTALAAPVYIVQTATATLANERVLTDTVTVTWDFSTPGQAKATAVGSAIADADYGDIVVSGAGTSWLLDSTIAGTAGGRTVYGGNAANDDLHLYSTSHATKGYVYVHDDLVIGDAGTEAGGVSINGTNYEAIAGIHDIGGARAASLHLHRHSTTLQNYLLATRSATEDDTHAALTNADIILTLMGAAYTGTHYDQCASIEFLVGAGTVTGTSSPGRIRFRTTPDGSQTPTTRLDILATGQINTSDGLSVGGTLTAQTGDASTAGLLKLGASGGAQPYDASLAPSIILGRCDPISTIVASSASGHIRRRHGSPTVIELAPLAWADAANAITSVPTSWSLTNSAALTSAAIASGELTTVHDNTTADAYGSGTATAPYYSHATAQPTGTTVQIMKLRMSAGSNGSMHCAWGYAAGRLTVGVDITAATAADYRLRMVGDDALQATILTGQSAATATTGWWVRLTIDWISGAYRVDYASASGAAPTTAAGWTFGAAEQSGQIASNARNGSWVWVIANKRLGGTGCTGHYTGTDEYVSSAAVREATYAPWRTAGLTAASDPIVFAASIDCGVARLPDQATMRTILADCANQMPGDAATWTWSVTGSASANPAAATTYQAAASLTIKQAGSDTAASAPGYRYWAIRGKCASSSGTQTGTVETSLLPLVAA